MVPAVIEERLNPFAIRRLFQELCKPRSRDRLKHDPGIVGRAPQLGIQDRPDLVAPMIPRPVQIEGELG
jgi:hypothetical protein